MISITLRHEHSHTPQATAAVEPSKESKMYPQNGTGLKLIKSNGQQTIYAYLNEVPEKSGNFSDPEYRHEIMLNKLSKKCSKMAETWKS